jgi:hypothetical protein
MKINLFSFLAIMSTLVAMPSHAGSPLGERNTQTGISVAFLFPHHAAGSNADGVAFLFPHHSSQNNAQDVAC